MNKQNGLDAKTFNKVLYVFVFFVIALVILMSVYSTLILSKMSKELSNNKFIALNNNEKIGALIKLKEDYENVSYERERLESYIPEEKEASSIVKSLETLAQKNALSFTVYKIDPAKNKKATDTKNDTDDPQIKKGDDYNIFAFEIELKGSYSMVDKMIGEMEGHDRLLEIKKIAYTPQDKDNLLASGDGMTALLQVNAYLRK